MKKKLIALLLVVICIGSLSAAALAEGEWNESLYRINDYTDTLTDDEIDTLDTRICDRIDELRFDFVFCVVTNELQEDDTLSDYGDYIYERNEMGYGSDHSGILLMINSDSGDYCLVTYGEGKTIFSDAMLNTISEHLVLTYQQGGLYQALNVVYDEAAYTVEQYRTGGGTATTSPSGGGSSAATRRELPDWYPEDVSSFVEYQDPNAPSLTDNAGVFTDSEKAAIALKLSELRQKYGADFVVFTDSSSYGFDHATYSADYYVFNGHGVGGDANGMIFFLCMEPGNRGWYTNATGRCQRLFSMDNIEKIDDRLEPYMVRGQYGEGVLDYLGSIDTLFRTGKAPRSTGYYAMSAAIAIVAGLVVAAVITFLMRAKMKTVAKAVSAGTYLKRDSFNLTRQDNIFLYRNVTRSLRQTQSRSGGGGSYGGSSSSSSGRSFSGGGRRF